MDNTINVSVDGTNEGVHIVNKPRIGLTFSSENEAFECYNQYGGQMGFSVRRDSCHKSKEDKSIIVQRRFVCSKEGERKKDKRDKNVLKPRAETRTKCLARMGIVRLPNGHYECRYFEDEHNHELHTSATTHFMRSQRAISNIDGIAIELAASSGIKPRAAFDYLGMQVGGSENIGFTKQDLQNYLRTKRQRALDYGDAGALGKYFATQTMNNPSFTYTMQYDVDEQVTNIFWADPRMLIDYQLFGDVVSFDTTFCTNKEYRPLAIFAGFNHHRGAVIFGAALLYDETIPSFKWLFERFLEAHGHKKPITIFTDQDSAMAAALSDVLPDTKHGLCTWHILQNGITHHGNLMKEGNSFLNELKRCMYEYIYEEEFEIAWRKFREDYPYEKSTWLDKLYGIKEKWARCYMKNTFTLGVRSTQISESINSDMKDYLGVKLNVPRFFEQFERVLKAKRDNELKADFDGRNKLPMNFGCKSPILAQVGKIYTPYAHKEYLEEYNWVICCILKSRIENEIFSQYMITVVNDEGVDQGREYTVLYIVSGTSIECSCRKFESMGILCRHALRIFQHLGINELHSRYILKRWTCTAKNLVVENTMGKQVVEDVRLDYTRRFRYGMSKYVKIVTKACYSLKGFEAIINNAEELEKEVDSYEVDDPTAEASAKHVEFNKDLTLKKKEGGKGGKRIKRWVENGRRKKKCDPKSSQQMQVNQCDPIHTQQHLPQPTSMWDASNTYQQSVMSHPMSIPSSQVSSSTPILSQVSISTLRNSQESGSMIGSSQASYPNLSCSYHPLS